MDNTLRPLLIPPQFALYAEKHNIFELYQRLLSQVIIHKPNDPIEFMIDLLKKDANSHAVVIIGPPASGKKSLSQMLAKKTGSILLSPKILMDTLPNTFKVEFAKDLKNLNPQQWARIIKQRTEDYDCTRKGWILENFPQTREQSLALLASGVMPKHTIVLQGADSMLIERAAGKRVDPKTGEIYHTTFDWPSEHAVQQRLVIPPNNTEQDLVNRLILYKRHVDGVTDSLKATSKQINVDQPMGDVFNQILEFVSRSARSNMPITPRIVLIGPAGSGKRTQASALAKKYDIVHVSMSSLIKEAVALENPVGVAIAPYVQKRQRVRKLLLGF
jgi:adenylate kinase